MEPVRRGEVETRPSPLKSPENQQRDRRKSRLPSLVSQAVGVPPVVSPAAWLAGGQVDRQRRRPIPEERALELEVGRPTATRCWSIRSSGFVADWPVALDQDWPPRPSRSDRPGAVSPRRGPGRSSNTHRQPGRSGRETGAVASKICPPRSLRKGRARRHRGSRELAPRPIPIASSVRSSSRSIVTATAKARAGRRDERSSCAGRRGCSSPGRLPISPANVASQGALLDHLKLSPLSRPLGKGAVLPPSATGGSADCAARASARRHGRRRLAQNEGLRSDGRPLDALPERVGGPRLEGRASRSTRGGRAGPPPRRRVTTPGRRSARRCRAVGATAGLPRSSSSATGDGLSRTCPWRTRAAARPAWPSGSDEVGAPGRRRNRAGRARTSGRTNATSRGCGGSRPDRRGGASGHGCSRRWRPRNPRGRRVPGPSDAGTGRRCGGPLANAASHESITSS